MVTNGLASPRYTPLETLLFFSALRDQDLTAIDFGAISGSLLDLPLVKNDAAFDPDRLAAEALQKLYLKLIKAEAREEALNGPQQNGDASPGSRKRKAATPPLPTVEAAAKHAYLLPKLHLKLYSRYRDAEIDAINEEQQAVERLTQEIEDIEAGKWDEQLSAPNGTTAVEAEGGPHKRDSESIPNSQESASVLADEAAVEANGSSDEPASAKKKSASTQPPIQPAPSPALQTSPGKQSSQFLPALPAQQTPQPASQSPASHKASLPGSPSRNVPLAPAIKNQPIAPNGYPYPPGQHMPPGQYGSPGQRPIQMAPQPAGRGYPGYPQQYPYQQGPYAQQPPPQQQFQLRPSQQGGFQLPPFQVAAQDPSKAHPPTANQPQAQQSRTSTPHGTPKPAHGFAHVAPAPNTPQPSPHAPIANDRLTESVVASLRKRRSANTWKSSPAPAAPKSPKQPDAEPISPVRAPAQLKQERQKTPAAAHESDGGRREKSDTKRLTRATRGSSVASSTQATSTRGRTRSRSIMSPAPQDGSTTRRGVKVERSTPAEPDVETPQPRNTRTRRSTLPPPPSSTIRRNSRTTPAPDLVPPGSDLVYATRNFSRLSAVIMSDVSAHRHAGPFQKPVSDRDVEGYHEIIKRPQDIKSIKASISAGAKAVAAALAAHPDEDSGTNFLLAKNEDLIPPRGIINPAQLEKEVMRMFANAVLFSPGDEGLVRDAREMAEDVAGKIGVWRGVEREDEEEGGSSKRRKL